MCIGAVCGSCWTKPHLIKSSRFELSQLISQDIPSSQLPDKSQTTSLVFYEMGVTKFSKPKPISNITASIFHSPLFNQMRSNSLEIVKKRSNSLEVVKKRHWKRCRLLNDKAMELTDIQRLSGVLFVSVKLNTNTSNLYYWVIPSGYAKKEVRDRDIPTYGTFAGSFQREIVTLVITDYYPYVKNVLFLASTTTTCVQKMIKRRFLPLCVCLSLYIVMSSDFHSHVQDFYIALSEGHFDVAQQQLDAMNRFVVTPLNLSEENIELYKQVVLNENTNGKMRDHCQKKLEMTLLNTYKTYIKDRRLFPDDFWS